MLWVRHPRTHRMKITMPRSLSQHARAHSTKKKNKRKNEKKKEREREKKQTGVFPALAKTSRDTSGEKSCASSCDSADRQKGRGGENKRKGGEQENKKEEKQKKKVFPATTLRPRTHQGKSATSYDDASRYALETEIARKNTQWFVKNLLTGPP